MPTFPSGRWDGLPLEFSAYDPIDTSPAEFVLVFAWRGNAVLLAEIADRGWCVPSGKVEVGELPEEAASRELSEETGAVASTLVRFGRFRVGEGTDAKWGDAFVASGLKLAAIPSGSESHAARFVDEAELPRVYFDWNELFAAVFTYSRSRIEM